MGEILQSECPDPAELRTPEQSIFACLKFLKAMHRRASVDSVLDYLHTREEEGKSTDSVRSSLRWFFKAAAIQQGEECTKSTAGNTGIGDQGRAGGQGRAAMGAASGDGLRRRHLQWRTKQTYRGWAHRFAAWLGERPVAEVGTDDIRGFLDHLAVGRRMGR